MPPPVPNPLNLPISHTFVQTMYVQMQQKTEGLGKYRQELCFVANVLGLIMIKKKRTITCQLKPIISIFRLQLQVNTCHIDHSGPYQKMAHPFGRSYFKLTFNGTVIFRQPSFLL